MKKGHRKAKYMNTIQRLRRGDGHDPDKKKYKKLTKG
jgi:hypothetical protein